MAIFSCSTSVISRSKGRQICASAAYQAREKILDIRQNQTFAYRNRDGEELLVKEVMLPAGAPAWDRSKLWNEAENAERRKDAQTARAVRLALPREMNFEQMRELVRNFLTEQFLSRGLACDYAIHTKVAADGGQQPHVHVLVSTRTLSDLGWAKKKDRQTLCSPKDVRRFRSEWSAAVNASLCAAGIDDVVDHRSLSEQREEVKEFMRLDSLDIDTRTILQVALHELSRVAEGKARPQDWQAARRLGELPAEIQSIRDLRSTAFLEAKELLYLLESREQIHAKMKADVPSQNTKRLNQSPNELAPREDTEIPEDIEFDASDVDLTDNPSDHFPR